VINFIEIFGHFIIFILKSIYQWITFYQMQKDPMELMDDYSKEIEIDTQIDVTNIMDKQLSSPNMKHKWLYRMIKTKKHLLDLIEMKDAFINTALNKDNPLRLSKAIVANKLETQGDFKNLQKMIKEQELLVEFLDSSVNKIFSQMGFDFRNLVELMKMEQL
jgi:cell division protein FtsL